MRPWENITGDIERKNEAPLPGDFNNHAAMIGHQLVTQNFW